MNVIAVGLLIQVLLVRYEHMSHVTSYIAQTVTSVQLSFLLSRYLSWTDRDMGVVRALARFNVRQLGIAGVGMAGYAWLDRLGMNYIAANVAVTAALAPVSFLAHHGWPLSRPAYSRRRAGRLRRARELMVIAVVGTAIGGGLYVLGSYSILLVLLVTNSFNIAVAGLEARWRFYALRNPEAAEQLAWPAPIKPGHERISFSSIVCALDEADAIGATLEGLIRQTHRRHQIVVSLRDHDTPTIAAVRDFQLSHPGAIDLIVGHYEAAGKHAQLNGALRYCTGDYIGPIDSEDDVAPELLVHVESLIRRTNADIVQGGVQLMNLGRTWQEWYKVHNVEEYRAWYSSRMAFQVSAGFVPLGGNTVYTRASLDHPGGGRVWLLIALVSVFDLYVRFPCAGGVRGLPGRARVRTGSDRARMASFRVAGVVRAGHAGAGRAEMRCQQVMNAVFHGQSRLIFRVRRRAWRTSRAGTCHSR